MTARINLGVIDGDGIGPEVIDQARRVLDVIAAQHQIEVEATEYDLGARRYQRTGEILSDETLAQLRTHDALLLGAVGDPRAVPAGLLERGLLLKLRFAFDHYVNLRPVELLPGVASPLAAPGAIDFVVVREGTEGLYTGNGGALRVGTDHEVATEVSVNTAFGAKRLIRYAFELAATRERRHVTLVHKKNVLVNAGGMWQRLVDEVAADFPTVTHDYLHVDAATIFFVTDPQRFDVIVTDNLFGDILTDLAAAITGGIGLAASGNINPDRTAPSMFEPIHGSAPDIAGQGVADPTAAVLSVALLLRTLGHTEAADQVHQAVRDDVAARDGAARTTAQVGDAIIARLEA
ncbi:3-isopropylmalate dehydrogenase [Pseudoclavibacter soli]|uniref:3-isopropylmalate dehydrogenase n=1 Tax=Pseudoclavibacter soli TaxID=452623 RepID=UPI000414AAFF|nr:3-isopropylmalate dehydrogenase [Pseudoclavibacter soli]